MAEKTKIPIYWIGSLIFPLISAVGCGILSGYLTRDLGDLPSVAMGQLFVMVFAGVAGWLGWQLVTLLLSNKPWTPPRVTGLLILATILVILLSIVHSGFQSFESAGTLSSTVSHTSGFAI